MGCPIVTLAPNLSQRKGLTFFRGVFPLDSVLKGWLRAKATEFAMYGDAVPTTSASPGITRINHEVLDELFENPVTADKNAVYAKHISLDLSTLSPFVSGPNSVKVATPLHELEPQNIKIHKAYLVSCTNSRRSDIAAAAKVFKDAAAANGGEIPQIPEHVKFYISAASLPEQQAAEEQGDWQALIQAGAQPLPSGCATCIGLGVGLLEPGEIGISCSNRNYKGRLGSTEAKAYLSSPEVVASSALAGRIAGPGWYEKPEGWSGVAAHEGEVLQELGVDEALSNVIDKLDSIITAGQIGAASPEISQSEPASGQQETLTEVLPGFPEKVTGEIVFCDADNLNTDGIYPGMS
jgi:homoaconitate hydratase